MKRTLFFAAVLCGMTSFAVDPVAVWNGDFNKTAKIGTDNNTYTLSANGNTVSADGSSITISASKGVKIILPTNTQEGSVIVKYSDLTPAATDTFALMTMGGGNNTQDSNIDIMGACCVGVSRAASGVWDRKRWTNKDSGAGSYTESGTMAYVYKYNDVARGYANGALIYTADKKLQGSAVYLKHLGIGGKQSGLAPADGTDVTPAIGMNVEAIAIFSGKLSDADIAAYEFPASPKEWVDIPQPKYEMLFDGNLDQTGSENLTNFGENSTSEVFVPGRSEGKQAYRTRIESDGAKAHPHANLPSAVGTSYTVTTWVKTVDTNGAVLWALGNSSPSHKVLGLMSAGENKVTLFENTSGNNLTAIISNVKVSDSASKFHHLAVVVNGNKASIYVDGDFAGIGNVTVDPTRNMQLGSIHGGTAAVSGTMRVSGIEIDEWAFYAEVLNARQIAELANDEDPSIFVEPTIKIAAVETKCSEDYSANTITGTITDYVANSWEGEIAARVVVNSTAYSATIKNNAFSIEVSGLTRKNVYRTVLEIGYTEKDVFTAIATKPVALYQGERQFVWMADELELKEATTISAADGCTIKPVCNDPDYIDTCDSIYSVTLSASEAVEATADTELDGTEQGGLRLVKNTDSTVKLEYVYDDNGTLKWGDQWPNGTELETVTRGLNESITVRVEFHYSKGGEDDISYVKYSIGENYEKSVTSWAKAKKVTEVFIADGTVLPSDLTGLFQLDKAVVVDVEVEIGHGDTQEITAADQAAAQAIADKMVIAIASEVAEKLTAEQKAAYQGYFKVKVTDIGGGKFTASVVFAADVEKAIKEDLEDAIEKVAAGIETGSAEIAAKPGLYYGVKRGDSLGNMNTIETELATSDKVTIKIAKPEGASAHFYRIIVSPTPETK